MGAIAKSSDNPLLKVISPILAIGAYPAFMLVGAQTSIASSLGALKEKIKAQKVKSFNRKLA
jgi:hypothetical protein